MLSLYLVLQLLAGSHALHHWFHADSHAPDHQCVINQVAAGELLADPPEAIELRPDFFYESAAAAPVRCVAGADLLLPPGRAPPASPA
jgi:hypothetical protein